MQYQSFQVDNFCAFVGLDNHSKKIFQVIMSLSWEKEISKYANLVVFIRK